MLTNPDMLHRSMLPGHERWASFLRALSYVVVDECHAYRGVFGSHVAARAAPAAPGGRARTAPSRSFVLASATVVRPAAAAARLVGARRSRR